MRAEVASPTYLGGVWDRSGAGLVHPGQLVAGLRDAALRARRPDPRAHAGERVGESRRRRHGHDPRWRRPGPPRPAGHQRLPRRCCSGSGTTSSPVYDYVLVTEPLSAAQKEAIGWRARQGIGDAGNQFHYYRLTADDRILWGGYDAVYRSRRPGRRAPRRPRPDLRDAVAALLHDLPAAGRPALHPPLGRRDRHLLALLGVLRHRRSAAVSPTRPATPASASPRRASAPVSASTSSTAARPRPPRLRLRPAQARPVPARAAARPASSRSPERELAARRPQRRSARAVAASPRPPGPGLRQLIARAT